VAIDAIATPALAPRANAIVERVIGTMRRECLDHLIVLDEQHLRSALREFVRYYYEDRPHRTLGLQTPEPRQRPVTGPIRSRPVLNGLHHAYERAARARQRYCRPTTPDRMKMRIRRLEPGPAVEWACEGDYPGWAGTRLTWALRPTPNTGETSLPFRHDGFADDYGDEQHAHVGWVWGQILGRPKAYAETGQPQPYFARPNPQP
jgi:hypothetical protein